MHAFDVLGDPVRRRILDLLADGERAAGAVVDVVAGEFGVTQPAVSRQLRILREHGFATVRAEGARRIYAPTARASTRPTRRSSAIAGCGASVSTRCTPIARGSRASRAGRTDAGDEPARRKDA